MPLSLDQHDFMVTFTGRRVNPTALRPEDIDIRDIAHALSNLCRFTGHCRHFYSVAQHCIYASIFVAPEFAMEALLHDAAEAYINDLSRPLKHHPEMRAYVEVERRAEAAIREHFKLRPSLPPEVKEMDNMLVCDEARALMEDSAWTKGHPCAMPQGSRIVAWYPETVETSFLQRYEALR